MSKTSKHLKKILAFIWLGTGILSIGIAAKEAYAGNTKNALIFGSFALVSFYFFQSRRKDSKV